MHTLNVRFVYTPQQSMYRTFLSLPYFDRVPLLKIPTHHFQTTHDLFPVTIDKLDFSGIYLITPGTWEMAQ